MKKGLRVVSTITLVCFLTTQSVWGAPGAGIELAGKRELPAYLSMDVPADLGTVDALYEAPAGANPQFILHIQNAHANYQAQMKIKQLLGYMNKKYGFKTIFVEGASEKLDPDYLRLFPDQERNLKLCDELAKQGELTGAELFMMEAGKDIDALGVEEAALYKANYDALKKVFGAETDVTRFFKGFDGKLDKVASKTFTPETRELIADWKRFEQGRREFMPFVKGLTKKSKKVLNVDLESLFSQVGWPQISRLLVIQQLEKDLNKAKGREEQVSLINWLRTKGVSKELLATLENFNEGSIAVGKSATEVSPREVLERLASEAGPKGFKFSDYPAFSLFAGYVTLRSELDPKVLFEEIEYLFTQMLDTLTKEPQQKALLALYRDGELLRKLLHLELNRAQWRQLLAEKDHVAIPSLVARLRAAVIASGDTTVQTEQQVMPKAFSGKMDELFTAGLEFYDFAHKREAVFYKEMQTAMAERKITKAILITGGFHTDGMSDLFREKAISYGIVTPRLSEKSDENLYRKIMLQNEERPFSISYLEAASMMQDPSALIAQLGPQGFSDKLAGFINSLTQNGLSLESAVREINAKLDPKLHGSFESAGLVGGKPFYKWVPATRVANGPDIAVAEFGKAVKIEVGAIPVGGKEALFAPALTAAAVPMNGLSDVLGPDAIGQKIIAGLGGWQHLAAIGLSVVAVGAVFWVYKKVLDGYAKRARKATFPSVDEILRPSEGIISKTTDAGNLTPSFQGAGRAAHEALAPVLDNERLVGINDQKLPLFGKYAVTADAGNPFLGAIHALRAFFAPKDRALQYGDIEDIKTEAGKIVNQWTSSGEPLLSKDIDQVARRNAIFSDRGFEYIGVRDVEAGDVKPFTGDIMRGDVLFVHPLHFRLDADGRDMFVRGTEVVVLVALWLEEGTLAYLQMEEGKEGWQFLDHVVSGKLSHFVVKDVYRSRAETRGLISEGARDFVRTVGQPVFWRDWAVALSGAFTVGGLGFLMLGFVFGTGGSLLTLSSVVLGSAVSLAVLGIVKVALDYSAVGRRSIFDYIRSRGKTSRFGPGIFLPDQGVGRAIQATAVTNQFDVDNQLVGDRLQGVLKDYFSSQLPSGSVGGGINIRSFEKVKEGVYKVTVGSVTYWTPSRLPAGSQNVENTLRNADGVYILDLVRRQVFRSEVRGLITDDRDMGIPTVNPFTIKWGAVSGVSFVKPESTKEFNGWLPRFETGLDEMNPEVAKPLQVENMLRILRNNTGKWTNGGTTLQTQIDRVVRFDAADLVGTLGRMKDAVGYLRDAARAEVRGRADELIDIVKNPATIQARDAAMYELAAVLKTEAKESAGRFTLQRLAELGPQGEELVPVLLEIVAPENHYYEENRLYAINALGAIDQGSPAVMEALAGLLGETSANIYGPGIVRQDRVFASADHGLGPDIGRAAELALVKMGAKTVPYLREALKDRDGNFIVRENAVTALGKIGPAAVSAVPELVQVAVRQPDETKVKQGIWASPDQTRLAAVRALGQVGPGAKAAVQTLIRILQPNRPIADGGKSSGMTPFVFIDRAPFEYEELRDAAATSLTQIGEASEQVIAVFIDTLRETGGEGYTKAKDPTRFLSPTHEQFESPGNRSREGLVKFGEAVVPHLMLVIDPANEAHYPYQQRRAAIEILRQIGPRAKAAVPVLLRLTEEPVARQALAAIGPTPESVTYFREAIRGYETELQKALAAFTDYKKAKGKSLNYQDGRELDGLYMNYMSQLRGLEGFLETYHREGKFPMPDSTPELMSLFQMLADQVRVAGEMDFPRVLPYFVAEMLLENGVDLENRRPELEALAQHPSYFIRDQAEKLLSGLTQAGVSRPEHRAEVRGAIDPEVLDRMYLWFASYPNTVTFDSQLGRGKDFSALHRRIFDLQNERALDAVNAELGKQGLEALPDSLTDRDIMDLFVLEEAFRLLDKSPDLKLRHKIYYPKGKEMPPDTSISFLDQDGMARFYRSEQGRLRIKKVAGQTENWQDPIIAHYLRRVQENSGLITETAHLPRGEFVIIGGNGRLLWARSEGQAARPADGSRWVKMPPAIELDESNGLSAVQFQVQKLPMPKFSSAAVQMMGLPALRKMIDTMRRNVPLIEKGPTKLYGEPLDDPQTVRNFFRLLEREIEIMKEIPDSRGESPNLVRTVYPGRKALEIYRESFSKIYDPATGKRLVPRSEARVPAVEKIQADLRLALKDLAAANAMAEGYRAGVETNNALVQERHAAVESAAQKVQALKLQLVEAKLKVAREDLVAAKAMAEGYRAGVETNNALVQERHAAVEKATQKVRALERERLKLSRAEVRVGKVVESLALAAIVFGLMAAPLRALSISVGAPVLSGDVSQLPISISNNESKVLFVDSVFVTATGDLVNKPMTNASAINVDGYLMNPGNSLSLSATATNATQQRSFFKVKAEIERLNGTNASVVSYASTVVTFGADPTQAIPTGSYDHNNVLYFNSPAPTNGSEWVQANIADIPSGTANQIIMLIVGDAGTRVQWVIQDNGVDIRTGFITLTGASQLVVFDIPSNHGITTMFLKRFKDGTGGDVNDGDKPAAIEAAFAVVRSELREMTKSQREMRQNEIIRRGEEDLAAPERQARLIQDRLRYDEARFDKQGKPLATTASILVALLGSVVLVTSLIPAMPFVVTTLLVAVVTTVGAFLLNTIIHPIVRNFYMRPFGPNVRVTPRPGVDYVEITEGLPAGMALTKFKSGTGESLLVNYDDMAGSILVAPLLGYVIYNETLYVLHRNSETKLPAIARFPKDPSGFPQVETGDSWRLDNVLDISFGDFQKEVPPEVSNILAPAFVRAEVRGMSAQALDQILQKPATSKLQSALNNMGSYDLEVMKSSDANKGDFVILVTLKGSRDIDGWTSAQVFKAMEKAMEKIKEILPKQVVAVGETETESRTSKEEHVPATYFASLYLRVTDQAGPVTVQPVVPEVIVPAPKPTVFKPLKPKAVEPTAEEVAKAKAAEELAKVTAAKELSGKLASKVEQALASVQVNESGEITPEAAAAFYRLSAEDQEKVLERIKGITVGAQKAGWTGVPIDGGRKIFYEADYKNARLVVYTVQNNEFIETPVLFRSETRVLSKKDALKRFNRVLDIQKNIAELERKLALKEVMLSDEKLEMKAKIEGLQAEKDSLLEPEVERTVRANLEKLRTLESNVDGWDHEVLYWNGQVVALEAQGPALDAELLDLALQRKDIAEKLARTAREITPDEQREIEKVERARSKAKKSKEKLPEKIAEVENDRERTLSSRQASLDELRAYLGKLDAKAIKDLEAQDRELMDRIRTRAEIRATVAERQAFAGRVEKILSANPDVLAWVKQNRPKFGTDSLANVLWGIMTPTDAFRLGEEKVAAVLEAYVTSMVKGKLSMEKFLTNIQPVIEGQAALQVSSQAALLIKEAIRLPNDAELAALAIQLAMNTGQQFLFVVDEDLRQDGNAWGNFEVSVSSIGKMPDAGNRVIGKRIGFQSAKKKDMDRAANHAASAFRTGNEGAQRGAFVAILVADSLTAQGLAENAGTFGAVIDVSEGSREGLEAAQNLAGMKASQSNLQSSADPAAELTKEFPDVFKKQGSYFVMNNNALLAIARILSDIMARAVISVAA